MSSSDEDDRHYQEDDEDTLCKYGTQLLQYEAGKKILIFDCFDLIEFHIFSEPNFRRNSIKKATAS